VKKDDDSSHGLEKPLKGNKKFDGMVEVADPSKFPMRSMTVDFPFNCAQHTI
jgi:hypothetical protein